jgi:hypothetical protein
MPIDERKQVADFVSFHKGCVMRSTQTGHLARILDISPGEELKVDVAWEHSGRIASHTLACLLSYMELDCGDRHLVNGAENTEFVQQHAGCVIRLTCGAVGVIYGLDAAGYIVSKFRGVDQYHSSPKTRLDGAKLLCSHTKEPTMEPTKMKPTIELTNAEFLRLHEGCCVRSGTKTGEIFRGDYVGGNKSKIEVAWFGIGSRYEYSTQYDSVSKLLLGGLIELTCHHDFTTGKFVEAVEPPTPTTAPTKPEYIGPHPMDEFIKKELSRVLTHVRDLHVHYEPVAVQREHLHVIHILQNLLDSKGVDRVRAADAKQEVEVLRAASKSAVCGLDGLRRKECGCCSASEYCTHTGEPK